MTERESLFQARLRRYKEQAEAARRVIEADPWRRAIAVPPLPTKSALAAMQESS